MKFAIYRSDLISVFSRLVKVVPTSKVSPVLNNVLAHVSEDSINVTATDLSNFLSIGTKCKSHTSDVCLIPAHDVLAAARSLSADALLFVYEDHTLKLRAGNTGWDWKVLESSNFPVVPQWQQSQVFMCNKDLLISALRKVRTAAASNSFSLNLEQVGFTKGTVQAADGTRFHQVTLDSNLEVGFPLPFVNDLISILPTLPDSDIEIGVTENQDAVIVRCGSTKMSTKTLQESFPDLSKAFLVPSMTNYAYVRVDKQQLTDSIKRVKISSNKESRAIKMTLKKESSHMGLMSSQPNGSFAVDYIDVESVPQDRTLVLNVDHLLQGIEVFDSDAVEFVLGDDAKNKPSSVLIKDDLSTVVLNQLREI